MRTFAQKQNHPQKQISSSLTQSKKTATARPHHPILELQHAIGNQAVQRMLQTNTEELEVGLSATASPCSDMIWGGFPLHPSAARAIQTKLAINKHGIAIQQPAISSHIALRPDKKGAAPAPGSLKFDGVLLGTNRNKQKVQVKREVGGIQGYDDRLQAIAVARLAKAEPSAVVLGTDEKWHALETTAQFEAGRVSADPKASETAATGKVFVEVYGVPSLTGIAQSKNTVKDLMNEVKRLNWLEKKWKDNPEFQKEHQGDKPPFLTTVQDERNRVYQNLAKANQTHAALILGVPESEIQIVPYVSGRTPGKVNIIGTPEKDSPGGGHAPMGGGTEFKEGLASSFWIDLPELDKPRAAETMFHEAQHVKDWDRAQEWIKIYKVETGRPFVKDAQPFKDWLDVQVKKRRLTEADAEMIVMEAGDASAYTEARANVRSFLADLQAGAPDLATKALVGYAHALKPKSQGGGGQYGSPAGGSKVQAALVMELKTAYRKMPKPMQAQYDAAVAAAKKEYPSAWISELDFSKRGT